VDRFLAHLGKTYGRRALATIISDLRVFFRYAAARGACAAGLADALESPRIYAEEGLPVGPSWKDVARIVATTRTNRPKDIRDRAILLLLAVYGLRRGEVAALRLENFDWVRRVIQVYGSKGREERILPLVPSVAVAVLRYLKRVRPRAVHREVFLTLLAPIRPLTAGGIYHAVADRITALEIELPHRGPHALRHACATRLLAQGVSLKVIGDQLGHRDPNSTRIYAKVDLGALREVAAIDVVGVT
jgi:site-specific recombinase XerD